MTVPLGQIEQTESWPKTAIAFAAVGLLSLPSTALYVDATIGGPCATYSVADRSCSGGAGQAFDTPPSPGQRHEGASCVT